MRTSRPLAALAGAALALGPALPAAASHDVTPDRIGGQTRYGTAAEIALDSHPDGASEVIIASGERYPDALAGSPIAAALDAPVLLVEQDHVPDATISALDELAPDHATILGGEVAVSAQVEQTIEEDGQTPADRIAGDTRYETAAKIAREVQQRNGNPANWPGDQRAAFLTTGEGFPDALSAGALAASREEAPIPVLLTRRDEVPAATEAAIEDLDIELVIVIGGPDAISEDVQAAIDDDDTTTDRVAGATRTATATAVADYAIQYLGFDEDDLTLTRGDAFPDALSVAPMTGANHNPILLTANATELSEPTRAWLAEACGAVDRILGIGQEEALSEQVLNAAETAAEDCHGAQGSGQDYIVEPQEIITTAPGESREFEVARTYDGADVAGAKDVALFPDESVLEPSDGEFRFADLDGDGHADGIGTTNTGAATITTLNGTEVDTTHESDVEPGGAEAGIQATLTSDALDAAAIVVFDDANDNGQLDVGDDGLPTEEWGFGLIRWES